MPRGIYDRSKMKKSAKKKVVKKTRKIKNATTSGVLGKKKFAFAKTPKKAVKKKAAKKVVDVRRSAKPAKRAQTKRLSTIGAVLAQPQFSGITIRTAADNKGLEVFHETHGLIGKMPFFKGLVTAKKLTAALELFMVGRSKAKTQAPTPTAGEALGNYAKQLGDIGVEFAHTQALRLNDISRNPDAALMLTGSQTHIFRALHRVSEIEDALAIMVVPDELNELRQSLGAEALRLHEHFHNHI